MWKVTHTVANGASGSRYFVEEGGQDVYRRDTDGRVFWVSCLRPFLVTGYKRYKLALTEFGASLQASI